MKPLFDTYRDTGFFELPLIADAISRGNEACPTNQQSYALMNIMLSFKTVELMRVIFYAKNVRCFSLYLCR